MRLGTVLEIGFASRMISRVREGGGVELGDGPSESTLIARSLVELLP